LSRETGEILEDLSALGYTFRFVEDVDNDTFIITTSGEIKGVLYFHDSKHEFFSIDIYGVSSIYDGKGILGFNSTSLVCYSTESCNKRWSFECPSGENGNILTPSSAGYMVIDNLVYLHTNYDTLSCIDPLTGSVVWQSGPGVIDENEPPLYRMAPTRFLGCSDMLYLGRNIADDGFLQARSIRDGSEQWRVSAPQARIFLIAGDLLFGSLSDVPVAWDRYTGEVVWKAEKGMTAIFHAVAASNKIIYTNTMSQMRCYEWTEPYHSPAKG
jgi:outer membrane protein assembly factor BamB